jgi:hypothetical protein
MTFGKHNLDFPRHFRTIGLDQMMILKVTSLLEWHKTDMNITSRITHLTLSPKFYQVQTLSWSMISPSSGPWGSAPEQSEHWTPEYCHTNFTAEFWSNGWLSGAFKGKKQCYFNTSVIVIDLVRWRWVG